MLKNFKKIYYKTVSLFTYPKKCYIQEHQYTACSTIIYRWSLQPIFSPMVSQKPSKTVPNSADTDTDTQTSCATATETDRIPVASQMQTHYVCKDDVLKAEILWALKVIKSHFSYDSSWNAFDLLKMMLPDSKIVEKLCLGSTKLAYSITHGLARFFLWRTSETDSLKICYMFWWDFQWNF